jgi:hypothetical protein
MQLFVQCESVDYCDMLLECIWKLRFWKYKRHISVVEGNAIKFENKLHRKQNQLIDAKIQSNSSGQTTLIRRWGRS